jgi:hypothetical protein
MLFAKVTNPNAGYDRDKELVKNLNHDVYYEVDRIAMGQSHTSVKLKDFPDWLNSVNLSFYKNYGDDEYTYHSIFGDPTYNPYL